MTCGCGGGTRQRRGLPRSLCVLAFHSLSHPTKTGENDVQVPDRSKGAMGRGRVPLLNPPRQWLGEVWARCIEMKGGHCVL